MHTKEDEHTKALPTTIEWETWKAGERLASEPRASKTISWIGTRRTAAVACALSTFLTHTYLLSGIMRGPIQYTSFEEFSNSSTTIIESPAQEKKGYEHALRQVVSKISHTGSEVALVVRASLSKKHVRALWVNRWNAEKNPLFYMFRTCSCKMGDGAPGCHFPYYIGNTTTWQPESCGHVPTVLASAEAIERALSGMYMHLASTMTGSSGTSSPTSPHRICPSGVVGPMSPTSSGVQRTPNSLNIITELPLNSSAPAPAFPTDAKEREKERKKRLQEQGIEVKVKKKTKVVEDHYDDCGEDLSCLLYTSPSPRDS